MKECKIEIKQDEKVIYSEWFNMAQQIGFFESINRIASYYGYEANIIDYR